MVESIACSKCKEVKPLDHFHRDRSRKNGIRTTCKMCTGWKRKGDEWKEHSREVQRAWRARNPDTMRARGRRRVVRKFGITPADYDRQLEVQNGVCAICLQPETAIHPSGTVKQLAIDHCAETEFLRGLLCGKCNAAIGLLRHDPEIVDRAAYYLRHHAWMSPIGLRRGFEIIWARQEAEADAV